MPIRDLLLAISVPCLWGFGFVITKPGMEQLPPMLINGLRWSLTGLVLVWWFPIPKKFIRKLLFVSFIGCTLQYSLTFSGLNIIDASSAVLLVQSEVPFGILIAFLLLKEKPSIKNLIGLFISFIGLILLTDTPNLQGKYLGIFLVLSGAFTWALAQVFVKPISEKLNGIVITAWFGVLAGPQLILASQLIEGDVLSNIRSANYQTWLIVLYLGLLMNALGYSIWYHVLGLYPVNKIMPVMLLLPLVGVASAIILLGEKPDLKILFGGFIILFGVGMILINKIEKSTRTVN